MHVSTYGLIESSVQRLSPIPSPEILQLRVWDVSLEIVMLVLLFVVLMVYLYFGVRIYSRMANIYMLQTYGSQIVAEIVSSTKLKHALNKLVRVIDNCLTIFGLQN